MTTIYVIALIILLVAVSLWIREQLHKNDIQCEDMAFSIELKLEIIRLHRHAMMLRTAINKLSRSPWAAHPSGVLERYVMSADLSDEIAAIQQATEVIDSAIVLVNSIPTLIETAVAKAVENGATAEQLQPLSDLSEALKAQADALAAAVVANTPAE